MPHYIHSGYIVNGYRLPSVIPSEARNPGLTSSVIPSEARNLGPD